MIKGIKATKTNGIYQLMLIAINIALPILGFGFNPVIIGFSILSIILYMWGAYLIGKSTDEE